MNDAAVLHNYLVVGGLLFAIGLVGVLVRRNVIVMFLSAEMLLQGVSVSLVAWGRYHDDWGGQVLVIFTIAVAAAEAGIAIIHQELSLLPHRTVAENIFMGREIARRGILDKAAMRERAVELLRRIGARIDPQAPVSSLSIALQQLVEIAKALLLDARILVMDEPTAALDERESRTLLDLVDGLRREGVSIVYISHRMPEVTAIADRITILKDGRKVWTRPRDAAPIDEIVRAMVGRDLKDFYPAPPALPPGEVLLAIEGGTNAACATSPSRCEPARSSAWRGWRIPARGRWRRRWSGMLPSRAARLPCAAGGSRVRPGSRYGRSAGPSSRPRCRSPPRSRSWRR